MLHRSLNKTNLDQFPVNDQLIQEVKEELTQGLRKVLKTISLENDDSNPLVDQITSCLPNSLPQAVFASNARAKAWVALNMLLCLPESFSIDGESYPLRRNSELIKSLTEPYISDLGFMLFWRTPEQRPKVINFIAENPLGLNVVPQSFMHWVAFILTQSSDSFREAVLSGSEEIELPINTFFALTSESPIKRLTCANHPAAVTVAVKINLAQPLVFLGHFSRGKNERGSEASSNGLVVDPKANLNGPTLENLYLAVHNACCCFVAPARRQGKEVSIEIYSANGQNLARKFEQRLQTANFCKVEASSFNSVNGGILEVVNQQSDLRVVVEESESSDKGTRRGRKPKLPSNF